MHGFLLILARRRRGIRQKSKKIARNKERVLVFDVGYVSSFGICILPSDRK